MFFTDRLKDLVILHPYLPKQAPVGIKHRLQSADHRVVIKHRLRTEYKTQTRYKTQTTDYVYKNSFREVKLRETDSKLA